MGNINIIAGSDTKVSSNDEMVDSLIEEYDNNSRVEAAFRAVDRALYCDLSDNYNSAPYLPAPWKRGNLHLSAPGIYFKVLEALDLQPGMSFLNLGSGTGYLNTIAGLIVGPNGVSHGVELYEDVVEFANKRLEEFKRTSDGLAKFDMTEPRFVQGNFLNLRPEDTKRYDRIYVGAGVPYEFVPFIKSLVKVGGAVVMPSEDLLAMYGRCGSDVWHIDEIMGVNFTQLVANEASILSGADPSDASKKMMVKLPDFFPEVRSLKELCRMYIRRRLRAHLEAAMPTLADRDNLAQRRKLNEFEGQDFYYDDCGDDEDEDEEEEEERRPIAPPPNNTNPRFVSGFFEDDDDDYDERRLRSGRPRRAVARNHKQVRAANAVAIEASLAPTPPEPLPSCSDFNHEPGPTVVASVQNVGGDPQNCVHTRSMVRQIVARRQANRARRAGAAGFKYGPITSALLARQQRRMAMEMPGVTFVSSSSRADSSDNDDNNTSNNNDNDKCRLQQQNRTHQLSSSSSSSSSTSLSVDSVCNAADNNESRFRCRLDSRSDNDCQSGNEHQSEARVQPQRRSSLNISLKNVSISTSLKFQFPATRQTSLDGASTSRSWGEPPAVSSTPQSATTSFAASVCQSASASTSTVGAVGCHSNDRRVGSSKRPTPSASSSSSLSARLGGYQQPRAGSGELLGQRKRKRRSSSDSSGGRRQADTAPVHAPPEATSVGAHAGRRPASRSATAAAFRKWRLKRLMRNAAVIEAAAAAAVASVSNEPAASSSIAASTNEASQDEEEAAPTKAPVAAKCKRRNKKEKPTELEVYQSSLSEYICSLQVPQVLRKYLNLERPLLNPQQNNNEQKQKQRQLRLLGKRDGKRRQHRRRKSAATIAAVAPSRRPVLASDIKAEASETKAEATKPKAKAKAKAKRTA